jgi:prephenate dehydrogenase
VTGAVGDDLLVVGTGLIGTSIGLAATAAGRRVWLADSDLGTARFAASIGAGTVADGSPPEVAMVVVAVPPADIADACLVALREHPSATVIHVSSVQAKPAQQVETARGDLTRFLGTHPIAGRELSGPAAAQAELFADRPWAVCPTPATAATAVSAAHALAVDCHARPVLLEPAAHDRILARLSHAPQVVASALAAALQGLDETSAGLAGTGIRDTTRLADSPPQMWGQIAAANATALGAALRAVAEPLLRLADVLERADADGDVTAAAEAVADLVRRGRAGRALLPGKHGRAPMSLATVNCVVPDEPGALARLLTDIAEVGVNVEDLRVDHAPGQPVGTAELAVAPPDRGRLITTLRERGWTATTGVDEAL